MSPRLWNPEKELMSRSETRALQLIKLKSLLNRVYEQSPYYRDKFDRAGVNPQNLKSCSARVSERDISSFSGFHRRGLMGLGISVF